tara:strand:- start:11867 stop:13174 length:1308 start_codon:yes stop_codon:yes gene_type:complete
MASLVAGNLVTNGLFAVSLILFIGYIAELIFKRFKIPDVLFLIILGFILGPHVLDYIRPEQLTTIAPYFTIFTLIFLLFDGAYNIDLASFAKGLYSGIYVTWVNFLISAGSITLVLYLFRFEFIYALLLGFMLGGVSSAFVIPLLKELHKKGEIFSVMALESASTDVLSILFAFTTLEIITLSSFSVKQVASQLISFFAVAGFIGIISGIIWIFFVTHVLKHNKAYFISIAYLLLVYVITEYMNGNGAIAGLFLGLILYNSKQLTMIFRGVVQKDKTKKSSKKEDLTTDYYGTSVTTPSEQMFYHQISFFLKTFFFVYIGILINLNDKYALFIGAILAVTVLAARNVSILLIKGFKRNDRMLLSSMFARGLAAAALVQIVIQQGLPNADLIGNITYNVVAFTTILSSITLFMLRTQLKTWSQELDVNTIKTVKGK